MAVADKVARRVGKLMHEIKRDHYSQEAFLYPYQNGREHGYALWVESDIPAFIFSESRGSDQIVVYEDKEWFCFGAAAPSEEAYKNSKHFRYDQIEKAAEYIVKRVKKLVRVYDRGRKKREAQWAKEEKGEMSNLGLRA
jgi:hypothetical protein